MRDDSFKEFVLDQLHSMSEVTARAMFGGHGLYRDGAFFGIIHNGRLYFKTDATTVRPYTEKRMKPFRPSTKQTLKNYLEVPIEIIEDPEQLAEWAKKAVTIARV